MYSWIKLGGVMFARTLLTKIGSSARKDVFSSIASSIAAVAFYTLAALLIALFTAGATVWLAYTALVSYFGFDSMSAIAILVAALVAVLVATVMVIVSYIKDVKEKIADARRPQSAIGRAQRSFDSVVTQFSSVADAFLDGLDNQDYQHPPSPRRHRQPAA